MHFSLNGDWSTSNPQTYQMHSCSFGFSRSVFWYVKKTFVNLDYKYVNSKADLGSAHIGNPDKIINVNMKERVLNLCVLHDSLALSEQCWVNLCVMRLPLFTGSYIPVHITHHYCGCPMFERHSVWQTPETDNKSKPALTLETSGRAPSSGLKSRCTSITSH